jgi:hypothetical protein
MGSLNDTMAQSLLGSIFEILSFDGMGSKENFTDTDGVRLFVPVNLFFTAQLGYQRNNLASGLALLVWSHVFGQKVHHLPQSDNPATVGFKV